MIEFNQSLLNILHEFKVLQDEFNQQDNYMNYNKYFYDYISTLLSIYFDTIFEIEAKIRNIKNFENTFLEKFHKSSFQLNSSIYERFKIMKSRKISNKTLCVNLFYLLGIIFIKIKFK